MIDLKKIQNIVFILLLFYSCSNDNNENLDGNKYEEKILIELKTINIDSVKNIYASWRSHNLLIFRYDNYSEDYDSLKVPFLLKRTEDDLIRFKTISNNWEVIDSFNNYLNYHNYLNNDKIRLSSEKMSYCFNLMERLDILSISNINESIILFEFKDDFRFYYIYEVDSVFFDKYKFDNKLKQLDNNWWAAP